MRILSNFRNVDHWELSFRRLNHFVEQSQHLVVGEYGGSQDVAVLLTGKYQGTFYTVFKNIYNNISCKNEILERMRTFFWNEKLNCAIIIQCNNI